MADFHADYRVLTAFTDQRPRDPAASYDSSLGEFVLPYADVRRAGDPDRVVIEFLREVHERASPDWPRSI